MGNRRAYVYPVITYDRNTQCEGALQQGRTSLRGSNCRGNTKLADTEGPLAAPVPLHSRQFPELLRQPREAGTFPPLLPADKAA